MYKELFKLAQDKGYEFRAGKPHSSDGKFYDNDINEWETTLIQKWLRKEHDLFVFEDRAANMRWYSQMYRFLISKQESKAIMVEKAGHIDNCYSTYEEALCKALIEALKLIK